MKTNNYLNVEMKSERGFGLADALIGVMLIGLIGVFLMGSLRTFIIGARTASDRAQALYLAQQVLENFKRNDGVDSDNQDWTLPTDPKYIFTSSRTPVTGMGNKLLSCRVTVSWVTPQGNDSLSLVSYYYTQ